MSPPTSNPFELIIFTAIAGLIANLVVHRWQRKNWFEQQRQLIHQQELSELKALFDKLTTLADARLDAMRSLNEALNDPIMELLEVRLEDYRQQVKDWNRSLRSFYPTTTQHYGYSITLELENEIHHGFYVCGVSLETAIRRRRDGHPSSPETVSAIRAALNKHAGHLSNFYAKLDQGMADRREEILYGIRYYYAEKDLGHFSTNDLVKALFISDVGSLYVVRPA